jgi:phosphate transport system permease protein
MTDTNTPTDVSVKPAPKLSTAEKRLKKRRAAEARFKAYGQLAIAVAIAALITLGWSIATKASSAFSRYEAVFDLTLDITPGIAGSPGEETVVASNLTAFYGLVQDDLRQAFPETETDRLQRLELTELITRLAVLPMAQALVETPELAGQQHRFTLPLSDDLDLFLKGGLTQRETITIAQPGRLSVSEDGTYTFTDGGPNGFPVLNQKRVRPDGQERAFLVQLDQTWFEAKNITGAAMQLTYLTGPQPIIGEQSGRATSVLILNEPEGNRTISNRLIAWTLSLKEQGRIERNFNKGLFTRADSTHPELAGAAAAIIGSLFTMLITALFAIPVGVLAAIYLEEFAPKNRLTSLIEVNINNLAAVPSIVFGLLGAAVFLNTFGMPRSIPLVGGLVLGLLVLPTVIITSRAALQAVPPSIRTAALGLGASKTQSVFHHVLPLAAPGILTGSIIGMARALGETAPLLLIGMVAFVAEIPSSVDDEATVLPVLIYKWSTGAERAWEPMTSAVIIILLAFLIVMNLLAVLLRRRFERRW